jgi:hypothetical protein
MSSAPKVEIFASHPSSARALFNAWPASKAKREARPGRAARIDFLTTDRALKQYLPHKSRLNVVNIVEARDLF